MDAFAVAVSSGIVSDSPNWKNIVKLAFFFGFFQFLMPVIGWLLGNGVSTYIEDRYDRAAFGLLAFIGVRMIIEVAKGGDDEKHVSDPFRNEEPVRYGCCHQHRRSCGRHKLCACRRSDMVLLLHHRLRHVHHIRHRRAHRQEGRAPCLKKSAGILAGIILIGIGVKILIEHMA